MRLSFDRLWITLALGLPALLSLLVPMPAVDLAYQVRAGNEILATGSIPAVDTWTFTVAGQPWVDQQWLAQVLLAAGHTLGGWELLFVLRAALVVLAFGLLLAAATERGASVRTASILALVAFLLAAPALALRPQLLGIAIFAGLLWLVPERHRRPRLYLLAPLLVVLWANVHGSFVLAPLVLGYGLLDDLLRGRPWRRSLAVLAVGTAATLVNPFGPGAWTYALTIGTSPLIAGQVSEWQRTTPFTVPGLLFYASAAAAVAILLVRRRSGHLTLVDWAWLAGWLAIGAWSVRGLAWWPLAGAFLVAPLVELRTGEAAVRRRGSRPNRPNAVVALGVGLLVVAALPWWRPPDPMTGRQGILAYAPSGLAGALRDVAQPGDRVFVPQTWASWFEWAAPEARYVVDSRFELFSRTAFESHAAISEASSRSIAELEDLGIGTVAVDDGDPLADLLRAAGWRRDYASEEGELLLEPDE